MDLGVSEKVAGLIEKVRDMIENEIAPLNSEYFADWHTPARSFCPDVSPD